MSVRRTTRPRRVGFSPWDWSIFGLGVQELARLRKGDVRKLAIARVIRTRTAMPNAWVARELIMGHASRLNHVTSAREAEISQHANISLERTKL